jgi:cell division protein ZipA
MPELRWTLAILGVLFVIGLALWELRRQRQAPGPGAGGQSGPERLAPTLDQFGESARVHREPTITLPELHPEPRVEPRPGSRREAPLDPPVVEVDEASFARLPLQGEAVERRAASSDAEDTIAMVADTGAGGNTEPEDYGQRQVSAAAADEAAAAEDGGESHWREGAAPAQAAAESHPVGATAAGAPVVDWPREESRKIVALRLVSQPAARFPGRAVRQALAAEGFVLGRFDIFHKPGPDERVVLSAASLTKPGTFTLNTIDAQRFGGISLFAVLPGPLPAQQAFDELLSTARNLNDRLQGALQDERGEPLTPMRSATIRRGLEEEDGNGGSGASAGSRPETLQ